MNANQASAETLDSESGPSTPAWIDHSVLWHVYPLGFLGSESIRGAGPTVHRLRSLERWLDYVVELGASGLLLGPVFKSTSHGYDTVDHFEVDPRLGSHDDFDHLVGALRDRGLRILLDGVFHHVGREHPRFVQAISKGEGSDEARWFRIDWRSDLGPTGQRPYATFEATTI